MPSSVKVRKLVARNGTLGYLQGETFYPESNFIITTVICCIRVGEEKGWLIKIKVYNQDNER